MIGKIIKTFEHFRLEVSSLDAGPKVVDNSCELFIRQFVDDDVSGGVRTPGRDGGGPEAAEDAERAEQRELFSTLMTLRHFYS